jgi:hypothetical protein
MKRFCPREALADHALKPRAYQHQVRRACRQQRHRQRDMHSLAGCFEGRSHDGQNILRFYSESLGDYFSLDSGLVYDSGTPVADREIQPETAEKGDFKPSIAHEPAGTGLKLLCPAR